MAVGYKTIEPEKKQLPEGSIKKSEEAMRLEQTVNILKNFTVTYKNHEATTPQEFEEVRKLFQKDDFVLLTNKESGYTVRLANLKIDYFGPEEKAKKEVKGKEEWQYGIDWKTADVNQGKYTFIDAYKDGDWDPSDMKFIEQENKTIPAKRNAENVFGEQGNYEYKCGPCEREDGIGGPDWDMLEEASKLVVKTYYIENVPVYTSANCDTIEGLLRDKLVSQFGVPAHDTDMLVYNQEHDKDATKWLITYAQYYDKSGNPLIRNSKLVGTLLAFRWSDSDTDPYNPDNLDFLRHLGAWVTKSYHIHNTLASGMYYIEYNGATLGSSYRNLSLPCFVGIEKVETGVEENKVIPGKGIMVMPTIAKGPVSFEYKGPVDKNAKLEIHDISGRLVKTAQFGSSRKITLDASDMAGGIYFAKVGKETAKFTVVK